MHSQSATYALKETPLRPSFWRTCRALKNRHRLNLLKAVFDFEGEFGVTAFGERAGLPESTASEYLRQMNARGLIGVRRERQFVYYNTMRNRSLPRAISLQAAFIAFFKTCPKGDWQTPLLKLLQGYTHPNRLTRFVSCLTGGRQPSGNSRPLWASASETPITTFRLFSMPDWSSPSRRQAPFDFGSPQTRSTKSSTIWRLLILNEMYCDTFHCLSSLTSCI